MAVAVRLLSILPLIEAMAVDPNFFLVDVRLKAIKTAIAMTSGAYKTSLVSYLTHRDLFPSLMKV
jgi:hypothetical protein